MMRKVAITTGGEGVAMPDVDVPYGVIEYHEDGVIVEIPTTYSQQVPATDGAGNPTTETEIVEVDPTEYGEEATWADVNNLMLFDLKIGKKLYSWRDKPGYIHVGLNGTDIGVVVYLDVRGNGKKIGSTKATPVPSMLGNPALQMVGGRIAVKGQSYADVEFFDMSTKTMKTLDSIHKVKDSIPYPINFPERSSEDPEGEGT